MNGLIYLGKDDFSIEKGVRGNVLCNNIPGFSLVMFFSKKCQYCQILNPIFKRLPGSIAGCQFCIVNIDLNKQLVEMSKNTIVPLEYVPYIILYIDGVPYIGYHEEYTFEKLQRFVLEICQNIEKKQQMDRTKVKENTTTGFMYWGKPVIGDKNQMVCYLEFQGAYQPKK